MKLMYCVPGFYSFSYVFVKLNFCEDFVINYCELPVRAQN